MRRFFSIGVDVDVLLKELAHLDAKVKDTLKRDAGSFHALTPDELDAKYKEYLDLKRLYSSKLFNDSLSRVKIDNFSNYVDTLSQFNMLLIYIRNRFDFSVIENKIATIIKGSKEINK